MEGVGVNTMAYRYYLLGSISLGLALGYQSVILIDQFMTGQRDSIPVVDLLCAILFGAGLVLMWMSKTEHAKANRSLAQRGRNY